jgi:DNA-binding CsgD family transcriptional regulator
MSMWKKMQRALERQHTSHAPILRFDQRLLEHVTVLAEQERRPISAVANDLLSQALAQRMADEESLDRWRGLTPREQEITALVCLDYTYPEIAVQLSISPQTVKSHLRNVRLKFGATRKTDLMRELANWNFSAWDRL